MFRWPSRIVGTAKRYITLPNRRSNTLERLVNFIYVASMRQLVGER